MSAINRSGIDDRYRNPELPPEQRAEILVSQMTLREKIAQMLHRAPPIPRLGVPDYNWWNEGLHGVARAGRATVFPQAIGMAASFNVPLVAEIAGVISDEGRAKHHEALRQNHRGIYMGLTYWSPNINIFRDPRWGRGQETYGECPYLTARMGVAYVKGLQGDDPNYLKLVATPKHFAVHSGPEPLRHSFNAVVNARDLRETYLPAFKACVQEAGAWSVMPAYNRTNGEPCCGSFMLLRDILREEWGFRGYVVSDCWAIKDFHTTHHVTKSAEESVALAVRAGCDLNCGDIYPRLLEAVGQGLVTEEEITRCVERLFEARIRLGMFDPEEKVPWAGLKPEIVNCVKHRRLALKAAQESIVLLKNENALLPIDRKTNSILVVGKNASDTSVLLGNYNGFAPNLTTILEGIIGKVSAGTRVTWTGGTEKADLEWHLADVDVVVACLGFTPEMEGEETGDVGVQDGGGGGDRVGIGLPGKQLEMLRTIKASGIPVVVVLTGGSPIELAWAHENVPAIVMAWYPGEAGGQAVADVLFGDYNPAGRLPVTFIRSLDDIPPFEDYAMHGRTYRFMKKEPLYPFGHGLSYTSFRYSALRVRGRGLSVTVENTGARDGDEVVQVYVSHVDPKVPVPIRQLAGCQRIHLRTGRKKTVRFQLDPSVFAAYDDEGRPIRERAEFIISVGGGQGSGQETRAFIDPL